MKRDYSGFPQDPALAPLPGLLICAFPALACYRDDKLREWGPRRAAESSSQRVKELDCEALPKDLNLPSSELRSFSKSCKSAGILEFTGAMKEVRSKYSAAHTVKAFKGS
ncbi:hypothetical protein NPIL_118331 [Nephila pilipes]|uniref:Uncharacterized protein n=1 Tax=Nephila pilipes TaxID=299642 RepID=A0A8X6PIN0_NEPPI|nr:hypothetical protein NPIL_118331 [Nephila pilipes]